jgi:hypothetical protein
MNRPTLLALLILLSIVPAAQCHDMDETFTVAELREDFGVLRASLQEGHAGLYRYSSKAEIDRLFQVAAEQLTGPMTELGFLRLLAPVVAGAKDGHTWLTPSPGLEKQLRNRPFLLPLKLRFLGGKGYVLRDYTSDAALVLGSELTHINGKPLDEIVSAALPMLPSDGRIETSRYKQLEEETTFGGMLLLLYGPATQFTFRCRVDGADRTVTVPGLTASDLEKRLRARYPSEARSKPPIELGWRGGVPILTIRTFDAYEYRRASIDYAEFVRTAFREFQRRGATSLVIDVRDNDGGKDEYGSLLAAYLLSDPFNYYESLRLNADRFHFFQYSSLSNDDVPRDLLRANADGSFDLLGPSGLAIQRPLSPTFTGDLYVLVNGGSFSVTGEFASAVNHNRAVTFVGEEGGAGYYGNTSGLTADVTLPNTEIQLDVPMVRYTMAVSGYTPTDRGIIPDHEVIPTKDDLLAGRDAEMEYVFKLIQVDPHQAHRDSR